MMFRNERERLIILLNHWIEHNKEHGEEFRGWAKKAGDFCETVAQEHMLDAAQYMDKASESLLRALEELNKEKS